MRRRWMVLAAACALVAGACGGDSDETTTTGPGDNLEISAEVDDHEPLPLEQFMGWHEEPEVDWEAQEREAQELIVACMAEQGFEYAPVDHSQMMFADPWADLDEEEGTHAFAEKYGYGFSTFFEREQEMFAEVEFVDPNEEHLETLSEAEQEAWMEALHGTWPELDPSLTDEEIDAFFEDFVPTGCETEAHEEVFGSSWFGAPDPAVEEFWSLEEDLVERVQADPRMVAARADWVRCMAGGGHDFATPDDVEESIWPRMEELWQTMTHPLGEMGEAEFEALSDDERAELERQPPDYDRQLLAEIQADEIDVAVADFDCRQAHGQDFDQVEDEVRRDLEADFIEEHRELLEQVREEMP